MKSDFILAAFLLAFNAYAMEPLNENRLSNIDRALKFYKSGSPLDKKFAAKFFFEAMVGDNDRLAAAYFTVMYYLVGGFDLTQNDVLRMSQHFKGNAVYILVMMYKNKDYISLSREKDVANFYAVLENLGFEAASMFRAWLGRNNVEILLQSQDYFLKTTLRKEHPCNPFSGVVPADTLGTENIYGFYSFDPVDKKLSIRFECESLHCDNIEIEISPSQMRDVLLGKTANVTYRSGFFNMEEQQGTLSLKDTVYGTSIR